MEVLQIHIDKGKKSTWKGNIVYDFNYKTFWKKSKIMTVKRDSKKISDYLSLRGIRWFGGAQRLSETTLWYCHDACIYHLYISQTPRM